MNYFDELCEQVFGFVPKGKGKSYELFVNCVLKHLNDKANVSNDTFQKSGYSEDKYQLDGLVDDEFNQVKTFVESKNYLDRDAKVGRGDIQKLSGALQVLTDIGKGILASATDYTKPAVQYSKDLDSAKQKSIDLYVIRPIKEKDTEGLMMGLVLNVVATIPNMEIKNVIWTDEGRQQLIDSGFKVGEPVEMLTNIYNGQGEIVTTVNELYKEAQMAKNEGESFWSFESQSFLLVRDLLVPFEKIIYNLTYATATSTSEMHYEPVIYIKSMDGEIEEFVDVDDLKQAYSKITTEVSK